MEWLGHYAEWTMGHNAFLSIPFTWELQTAYQRASWLKAQGYEVYAGGPATKLMPDILSGVAHLDYDGEINALYHHNPCATFTTRGCARRCPFCAVWRIEGDLVELKDWDAKPVIADSNLTAASVAHFDRVIDSLKHFDWVEFSSGLDARLLTKHHADRLAEIRGLIRIAWDSTKSGNRFMQGFELLRKAGIPKANIRCYVLIGFDDTPDDALFRLRTLHNMGIMPNPMRYNPLDTLVRDSYVAPNWTERELTRFMRYWANLAYTVGVPFEEFDA
jgi:hypothetical protein